MAVFGSATPEAAHQKQLSVEREFRKLLTASRPESLLRYQLWILDLLDTGPVPTIRTALTADGATDRHQDEARERCLLALSDENLGLLEQRTLRELRDKSVLLRAIRNLRQQRRGQR